MYTIGEVAKKFNLTISAIRYYDKEGLLNNVKRENGIRKFEDVDVETIFMIECLKKSGMQIKEIKIFLDWVAQGDATLKNRLEMFQAQKEKVENQMLEMQKVLDLLKYKCWFYQTAIELGGYAEIKKIKLENMPTEIRESYLNSHN